MRIGTLCLFVILFSLNINAQTEWELKRVDEGITAYTRKRPGIKFKEYKVEMELEATLSQVMAIFKDFDVYTDLFPGTEEVKVLENSPLHHVTYTKFDIPFPARDRDAIFDNHISYIEEEKALVIDVKCLTDEYETNPKLIQIEFCEGGWRFEDIGNGKLMVVHNLIVDPAGRAPAWIVNSKTVDDPIKTYKSLRQMIKNEKYSGQSFTLLENQ